MEDQHPRRRPTAAKLWDALLPRYCLLCGLNSLDKALCDYCARDLPRLATACPSCALPLPAAAVPRERHGEEGHKAPVSTLRCGRCRRRPPPWNRAIAALLYRFPADALVQRFKFRRDLCCGTVLAEELLTTLRAAEQPLPDAIVPVPLHRRRWLARTFNQAELLALQLGHSLQLPVYGRLLQRRRATRAQSGLDAAARRQNVRGAFVTRRRTSRGALPRRLALVDDVMTTGVTLAACCVSLRRAGARDISVWVAARAEA
jgi:ComF family protein